MGTHKQIKKHKWTHTRPNWAVRTGPGMVWYGMVWYTRV